MELQRAGREGADADRFRETVELVAFEGDVSAVPGEHGVESGEVEAVGRSEGRGHCRGAQQDAE
ncbi:MAG: hypothetical protein S0880_32065 [Actinomycetota bacterium]|nr:hypothetical protein [Actinomycetota bacterium]